MPVYEYVCNKCGRKFERSRHFGDQGQPVCPEGHTDIHRVFSAPTIVFKGSGFYVTDHPSSGKSSHSADR